MVLFRGRHCVISVVGEAAVADSGLFFRLSIFAWDVISFAQLRSDEQTHRPSLAMDPEGSTISNSEVQLNMKERKLCVTNSCASESKCYV